MYDKLLVSLQLFTFNRYIEANTIATDGNWFKKSWYRAAKLKE
jgi:hypothetical protein